jgi:pimeloyl-ACP methyl ester carboxylesterase
MRWNLTPAAVGLLVLALPAHAEPAPLVAVFVADGAGDFCTCSKSVGATAAADGLPIEVHCFHWSHGTLRIPADQTDRGNVCRQGAGLAAAVLLYRADHPGARVALLGHSAGSSIILRAAERLPPDAVDRIVLLSPSLSADYDLGGALCSSREGVDNFFSGRDSWFLGVCTRAFGATDDRFASEAAGRRGFRYPAPAAGPHALRQHAWCRAWAALGHNGGHFGGYAPDFLRGLVFPCLLGTDLAPAAPDRQPSHAARPGCR